METIRFTNGQRAYIEILAYNNKHKLYAYEATEADVFDLYVNEPIQVGVRNGIKYYVITIHERKIEWKRVCKDVAINYALA